MNKLEQVIRLAENKKWAWHLYLLSMTRVKSYCIYVHIFPMFFPLIFLLFIFSFFLFLQGVGEA